MLKKILVLSLIACSGLAVTGCQTSLAVLDGLCEAKQVRVSPEMKAEFRRWLMANGHLKANAPKGADEFLKDLSFNQELIRKHCGKR